jgi:multidrug resistance efflux pump
MATSHSHLQSKGPLIAALELVSQLNQETRHAPAAMTFCNELAFHFKASRVALAYVRDDFVETVAISDTSSFNRRIQTMRDLETAMQEAIDQDDDIQWPTSREVPVITREHEKYAKHYALHAVCSMPLRLEHKPCGVVTLIREDRPFNSADIDALRLMIDLSTRRLIDLDRYGRQWWRQHLMQGRDWLAMALGPRHTWIKASALIGSLLAIILFLIPIPYRVTGDLILKADSLVNMPAPFDGFIKEVNAEPGDNVNKDDVLVTLDPTELKLKESESAANTQHYQSQALVAEGTDDVTQMHVYQAQADQADSELQQIRFSLTHAELRSPLAGVVVEGDLKDKIGSPVKLGDVLMKVALLKDLYVEAQIPEQDIQDVRNGDTGEVRLESRPADVFPITVSRVEPAAMALTKGNVFKVRCQLNGTPPAWWRPGMTGVIKIRSGYSNLWFILTHRLVDFLRLKLWI